MTQESPERAFAEEPDAAEIARAAELCAREEEWDRLEDAAHALLSRARQGKAGERA